MSRAARALSVVAGASLAIVALHAHAQDRPPAPPWTEDAPLSGDARAATAPRLPLRWDHYRNVSEMERAMRDLAAAFPDLVEVRVIGRSVQGRDLLLAVLTDRAIGGADAKPAFWCDGNIHGNEVQGGEASLYLLWWLCENRDLPRVRQLLADRAFYVLPVLNPDGRAHWFDAPNTMHGSRGGRRPVDNDRDGLFDEDGPEDLDGDGEILEMRVADPAGGWKEDPEDPRLLVHCKPGECGTWRLVGTEGRDDDGDGAFNEDGAGGYDPNRDWPSDWRTPFEQGGAGPYPVSLPETAAVVEFLVSHPNVSGFQSFHNAGGMILRGPGSRAFGDYPERDDRVMRAIGARGEEQIPFYRSMVIWKDLYQVHGGEVNFAYEMLGIYAFTNELWNAQQYRAGRGGGEDGRRERLRFDEDLELGARYQEWKPFVHPQLGPIELGGWRRETGRVAPPFMLQEMLHRNMAFVVYHASEMPLVRAGETTVRNVGGGLFEVDATFRNDGMIPTRSQRSVDRKIGAPDRATIAAAPGGTLSALTGGVVDLATQRILAPELRRPAELRLDGGIDGDGIVRLRWLVRGAGRATVTYVAEKGGRASLDVELPR